jgi:hypothetical protein
MPTCPYHRAVRKNGDFFLTGYDVRQGIGRDYPSNRLKPDGVPSPLQTSGQPRSPGGAFSLAKYLAGYLRVINLARAKTR